MATVILDEDLEWMKALDDAWKAQDWEKIAENWETLKNAHTEHVAVAWPGQLEPALRLWSTIRTPMAGSGIPTHLLN